MSISGIPNSSSTDGIFANSAQGPASRTDGLLNALQNINPSLADRLRAQVQELRKAGATPQQISQALRQTVGQLSASDQADLAKASQSIRGGRRGEHGFNLSATSTTAAAPSKTSIAGGDHDGDGDDNGTGPADSTLDVQA